MCGCFCLLRPSAEPQDLSVLLLSSPAGPCLEERGKHCFALPQYASKQPRAVCKHKMQVLGSALLVILFLLCLDRRMRSW